MNDMGAARNKGDKDMEDDLDYEKIVIYPLEYDIQTRKRLWKALRELGVRYEYEYY